MNQITIQFANGGYVLTTVVDGVQRAEVFASTAKLNKAVRSAVEELSLLPKKAGDSDAE